MSIAPHPWMRLGSCREADPFLFFGPDFERQPEREAREAEAKAMCACCLVRLSCLDFAVTTGQKAGVWGGLSEDERAAERRRRRRRVA